LALAPRGIWFAPKDLRLFYQVRQSWRGKAVLLKLVWRMFRARVFGDRMAAIGQSLMARMRLALKAEGIPLWLNAPMTELITDVDGKVVGAVVERDGSARRIGARRGVILATGGFDHDMTWRRQHLPELEKDWSFGNPAAMGDGIRAGEKVGGSSDLLDEAWWFPAICWPDGRLQFMLNERMMPSQFVVNGAGKRFINEAAPYMDFAHAMIEGQRTGVSHIPCWLVTDIRSFHRYVVAGHLPIPKVPLAPVPTGRKVPRTWLESGVVKEGNSFEALAAAIGVPADQLRQTAERFNRLARAGHDDDFDRGDSAYDNYYGDPTLPNPNLYPLGEPPYYAFQIILGDLGTSGGLRTDEFARVLRDDDSVIGGLYATGNTSAAVMGRSYAGAGATIGPAMTFGYVAAKHIADVAKVDETGSPSIDSTFDTYRRQL
jgi:succinate dehydrogenase/fumarate reductase flavoprotein subunit